MFQRDSNPDELFVCEHAKPAAPSCYAPGHDNEAVYRAIRSWAQSHCKSGVFRSKAGSGANSSTQSADDVVYEQDIIRDPASIKPWLRYIDHKYQYGTVLERAFVSRLQTSHKSYCCSINPFSGARARMFASTEILQTMEDGNDPLRAIISIAVLISSSISTFESNIYAIRIPPCTPPSMPKLTLCSRER